ncbi:heptaprenyl diphosphate synthase component II [Virgibacillus xinjiangensis]|uniref:Heptaprenyl diphosphate synthase component II n=1 Tax=Virgibacillus xinjiangensis TaxID=393090 RepID=A0ABV7CS36_9BACI
MKIAKIYGYLKKDLAMVEESLNNVIQAEHPVLRDTSTHLLKAGGKRIRPVFVVLAGQMGNYDLERVRKVAVALELIHMATLVHDDVIDDASLRRGEPTIKSLYDNRVAMYTGDYILARALEEITSIKQPNVHRLLAKTIVEVSVGEIEQIKDKYNWNQNLRNYLRRIKRKTALLIATSCELGGLVSGLHEQEAKKLYQYGYYIGMSYQIIDDILDFTSTEEELGKPVGNDLLQGNITLPVLFAMENADFRQLLQKTFHNPSNVDKEDMNNLIVSLKRSDAVERSYQLSEIYLQKALKSVSNLPDNKAKRTLEDIAKYIGKRRS